MKLHIVVKKQTFSGGQQNNTIPKQPKYQPNDFWVKLKDVLLKQYDDETVFDIISQFKKVGN